MSQERRMAVLSAIVEDYVQTSEPVGSKALLDRHQLNVSAATVRNDMAALEDEGLIIAPHTSAGRIPTDAGYRLFVDRLQAIRPMSRGERAAITDYLEGADDLDVVLDSTVRLLSTLTRQVAVVQYPSLTRSTVKHIELVPMSETRLMVVVIMGTGRVEQRVVPTGVDYLAPQGADALASARGRVNAATRDRRLAEALDSLRTLHDEDVETEDALTAGVIGVVEAALAEERATKVTLAGTANLARSSSDFPMTLEPVLDALEQHVVLLKLLSVEADQEAPGVSVRIGSENPVTGLQGTSLVTSGYGAGDEQVGAVGVLGPTRMDYPATMAQVRAVATYLSRIVDA
ncbi:heat-inducible transcriptional repressor HrcA [Janibacter indicus]|uniref:Heat-inducible transcription repressor HrcA n=1 Tax=Janibacter indicus TaxID=857417 RepID=A0A1L3MLC0_9MICO|nr:heat-inducible transcriptional repressor HrcA [Janibacter indicus]APH03121.1 HrcA family transcriptional regulator [Janibacter indicus]QOK21684.1 heat-inducible transcriptional repressor HrcA [Janibacter indicus]